MDFYKFSGKAEERNAIKFNEQAKLDTNCDEKYFALLFSLLSTSESSQSYEFDETKSFQENAIIFIDFILQDQLSKLSNQVDVQNILNTSKLTSHIYNYLIANKFLCDIFLNECLVELVSICLHNLNLLSQEQFNEFDFNIFLKLVSMYYSVEYKRNYASNYFPISFITYDLSPFIRPNIDQYGLDWLLCFLAFCSLPHTADEAILIFNELIFIKDALTDSKSIIKICYILIYMTNFNTIPKALFITNNFIDYLTKLAQSNDDNIVHEVFLVIGTTINKDIACYDQLDKNFFISLVLNNYEDEITFVYSIWILSLWLNQERSNQLINDDTFSNLVELYPNLSMHSKIGLSLFLIDIMELAKTNFHKYVTYDFLDLFVDALFIGNNTVVRRIVPIMNDIINTLAEDQNPGLFYLLDYLVNTNIFDVIDQLYYDEYSEGFEDIGYLYQMLDQYRKDDK